MKLLHLSLVLTTAMSLSCTKYAPYEGRFGDKGAADSEENTIVPTSGPTPSSTPTQSTPVSVPTANPTPTPVVMAPSPVPVPAPVPAPAPVKPCMIPAAATEVL